MNNNTEEIKSNNQNPTPNITMEQVRRMHEEGAKQMNGATGNLHQAQELLGNALKAGANILGETHKDLKELYFDYASSLLKEMESHSDEILAPFMDQKVDTPPPTPAEKNDANEEKEQEAFDKNSPKIASEAQVKDQSIQSQQSRQQENKEMTEKLQLQEEEKKEEKEEKAQNPADQTQVIFQLLEVARVINEKQIEQQQTTQKTLYLAQIHMKLGLLETMKDNLDQAFSEYQKSLELRKKVQDSKYSRLLAQTYFMIGHLLSGISEKVNQSVSFLKDAKVILMNCLRKELKINEDEEIKNEVEFLLPKKDDLAQIKGLKETIIDLNTKIIETQQDRPAKAEEIKNMLRSQFSALAAGFAQPSAERMGNIKDLGVLVSSKKKLEEEKKKMRQQSGLEDKQNNNLEKQRMDLNDKMDKEIQKKIKDNQSVEKRMKSSSHSNNGSAIKEIN